MSALWIATTLFVLIAALYFRVVIITRFAKRGKAPNWLEPALLSLLVLVAGVVVVAANQFDR